MFPLAFSFDWEALLPVLLILFYGISQFIGSRSKPSEENSEEMEELARAAREEEERAKQIRDEIRRRVSGRKTADAGAGGGSQAAPASIRPADRGPARQQKSSMPSVRKEKAPSVRGWQSQEPGNSLESQLREQRLRMEQTARERRKAEQQARRTAAALSDEREASAAMPDTRMAESVRAILANPANARQGILLTEILGPPVSSRGPGYGRVI